MDREDLTTADLREIERRTKMREAIQRTRDMLNEKRSQDADHE
jgi:hypothetical protein